MTILAAGAAGRSHASSVARSQQHIERQRGLAGRSKTPDVVRAMREVQDQASRETWLAERAAEREARKQAIAVAQRAAQRETRKQAIMVEKEKRLAGAGPFDHDPPSTQAASEAKPAANAPSSPRSGTPRRNTPRSSSTPRSGTPRSNTRRSGRTPNRAPPLPAGGVAIMDSILPNSPVATPSSPLARTLSNPTNGSPTNGSPTNGSLSGTRLRFSFWRRSDPICATHTVQPVRTRTAECIGADVHESRSASSSSCVVQALCTSPVTPSSSGESLRTPLLAGGAPAQKSESTW